jgi:hypothetical protein
MLDITHPAKDSTLLGNHANGCLMISLLKGSGRILYNKALIAPIIGFT